MSKSNQQTLQQERAKHAWEKVEAFEQDHQAAQDRKEYSSLVRGLPAMIQHDGFAPTLAFLCAKGKKNNQDRHNIVYTQIQSWLRQQGYIGEKDDLIKFLIDGNSSTYRHATTEAQAYLNWLKRFTEAKGWSDNG